MIFSLHAWADQPHVIIYTENLPPYNFLNEQGEVDGISTKQVRALLDATGLTYDIRIEPWVRAKRNAERIPNSLIYSMARTPEREDQFDWLVLLKSDPFYLFGLLEKKKLINKEAIRAGKFTAVCMGEDVTCGLLRRAGFPDNKLFRITSAGIPLETFRLMASGRADFSVDTTLSVSEMGQEARNFGPLYKLDETADFYLASSTQGDPAIREAIRLAYEKLKGSGLFPIPK